MRNQHHPNGGNSDDSHVLKDVQNQSNLPEVTKSQDEEYKPRRLIRSTHMRIFPRSYYRNLLRQSNSSLTTSSPIILDGMDDLNTIGAVAMGSTSRFGTRLTPSNACTSKCHKWDAVGKVCRLDFGCLLNGGTDSISPDQAEASIIKAAGCPMCHQSDYSGKCRVRLSCLLGVGK